MHSSVKFPSSPSSSWLDLPPHGRNFVASYRAIAAPTQSEDWHPMLLEAGVDILRLQEHIDESQGHVDCVLGVVLLARVWMIAWS